MVLTISKRLILGFSLVLVLLVLLCGFGAHSLSTSSASASLLAENLHIKSIRTQRLAYTVMDTARVVRNTILLTDEEPLAKNKAAFDNNRVQADKLLKELQALLYSDEAKRRFAELVKLNDAFFSFSEDVVKLGVVNDNAAGAALLFGPRYAIQGEYLKALEDANVFFEDQMAATAAEVKQSASSTLLVFAGGVVLAVVLGAVAAVLITRSIVRPLAQAAEVAEAVSQGDLARPIPPGGADEVGRLLLALDNMQTALSGMVGSVRQNAESVSTASVQIAQGNADLSQRTEEQASALQQTAATMEQLGTTVRNNADSAKQANQLAQSAARVAVQGGHVVGQVVSTMQGISNSSRQIGDIIGVIDGIAFQTNILALNAAVEAARAGEQGRGFAVVAGEVRTLAQRSAEAAKEIKGLIVRSVEQVEQGSALVDQAGQTMGDIVSSIQRVSDIVAEITSATVEQSSGISQVGDAIGQMDQVTQQNAALVEESAAAAESLKGQAQQLVQAVSAFKLSQAAEQRLAHPATAKAEPSGPQVLERRWPSREAGDARPLFKAKAVPSSAQSAPTAVAARADTGEWASF